jgi:hypothetical protein
MRNKRKKTGGKGKFYAKNPTKKGGGRNTLRLVTVYSNTARGKKSIKSLVWLKRQSFDSLVWRGKYK